MNSTSKTRILIISMTSILLSVVGCARGLTSAETGALAGAALGAGTGAIVGNQTGNAGRGVAIGAGLGAVGGALIGNSLDKVDNENRALEGRIGQNQALIEENRKLIEELRKRGADVRSSDRGVVINLPDILFDFDRSSLTPTARRTLSEIGTVLRDVKDRPISIEGHTDSIGTVRYNKQLSEKRARSVQSELSRNGIPARQMSATGFGEGDPIATNNTEMGRSRNRRVEIVIEN
jgi:outer membrane protein OmpA-like peptidoglycan-associated protein